MKKLMTLLLMALMVTGLQAQNKSDLPNVTLKDLNGKDVNLSKLSNNGNIYGLILSFSPPGKYPKSLFPSATIGRANKIWS